MAGFQLKVPVEELKKRTLFVGAPMYGGQCSGIFARSISDLTAACTHYGIKLRMFYLFNESLIPRARNYVCDEFMRSGDSHLMFIDADIGFKAQDVITMLAMMDDDSDFDVVCGGYPKKTISWEKIKQAVDKGVADENPNVLEKFVGDYVFNPANGSTAMPLDKPSEVLEAGTGFMMIRRKTLEKFQEAYPEQMYKPDHIRTENFDGSREICAFFDTPIDHKRTHLNTELELFLKENPKASHSDILDFVKDPNGGSRTFSKRYLSEDYMFCQWVRNIGLKVWMCPWMELQHMGSMVYGGSLKDLAAIGAVATASPDQIKKRKNK